jgi:integrase
MRSTTYTPEKGMTARQIEKALNKAVVEFEESALNATKEEYTKVKLSEFFKQYLNNVKHELSPKNYENYEHAIDNYIIPMLGHLKLRDIRPIHIQKFVNTMCKDGIRRDKKEGKLAPSTVHRYYVILQSIMHNAYSLEIIP